MNINQKHQYHMKKYSNNNQSEELFQGIKEKAVQYVKSRKALPSESSISVEKQIKSFRQKSLMNKKKKKNKILDESLMSVTVSQKIKKDKKDHSNIYLLFEDLKSINKELRKIITIIQQYLKDHFIEWTKFYTTIQSKTQSINSQIDTAITQIYDFQRSKHQRIIQQINSAIHINFSQEIQNIQETNDNRVLPKKISKLTRPQSTEVESKHQVQERKANRQQHDKSYRLEKSFRQQKSIGRIIKQNFTSLNSSLAGDCESILSEELDKISQMINNYKERVQLDQRQSQI